MADEIEDLGPISARPTTTGPSSASRPSGGQASSRPSNAPNPDRRTGDGAATRPGVVQPKPQALPKRSGPSAIIVSPRQKGNPVLNHIKSNPWEYGDIPADYVLGLTTCALFLSLKYHRLHPEYIYTRIKGLQGKYALRIVLCLVDIENHEESLKELSKTSIINNVTVILCWSAAEGGRYLELFKTYETAPPTAIKQHQSAAYADRMVDFVTTPRAVNKTDAVALVSTFGSLRTAVNARHEDVATIAGWGERKVLQWCSSVREPFRVPRAAQRRPPPEEDVSVSRGRPVSRAATLSRDGTRAESDAPAPVVVVDDDDDDDVRSRPATGSGGAGRPRRSKLAERIPVDEDLRDDEEAWAEAQAASLALARPPATTAKSGAEAPRKRKVDDDPLGEGVMAALAKLRK